MFKISILNQALNVTEFLPPVKKKKKTNLIYNNSAAFGDLAVKLRLENS